MRISNEHKNIIKQYEAMGYVWLSHMSRNGIERFRYRTRKGFKRYIKVKGLTFLTKEVAEAIELGVKRKGPRLTVNQQLEIALSRIADLSDKVRLYERIVNNDKEGK